MMGESSPLAWEQAGPSGADPLTETELSTLVSFAKRALWSPPEVRRRIQKHLVNITPANFYSDVPLVDDIEESFEYRGDGLPYLDLFDHHLVERVTDQLLPFAEEFAAPQDSDVEDSTRFHWGNPAFSNLDAVAYYSMLRLVHPEHVVEIGAGYSTLVAEQALRANGHGSLTVVEPYPKGFLRKLHAVERLIEAGVQDVPLDELVGLVDSADVLFIDSTHTVKIGSDCLYIYLLLLPRLQEPIVVHSHDVYLPKGMPKDAALESHVYWTEQYLLAALLHGDPGARVLFGSVYGATFLPDRMHRMLPGRRLGGGSLWYGLNGRRL